MKISKTACAYMNASNWYVNVVE